MDNLENFTVSVADPVLFYLKDPGWFLSGSRIPNMTKNLVLIIEI
jgi:hypothetical protein